MSSLSTKEFRGWAVAIILVIVGLFAWSQSQKPKMPSYVFQPNFLAYKNDDFIDIIKTEAELQTIKNNKELYDSEQAEIGGYVGLDPSGYYVRPAKNLQVSDIKLEELPDTKNSFEVFKFIPDTKRIRVQARPAEKITTDAKLRAVMADDKVLSKELASIGSYIVKNPSGVLVVIGADETLWRFEPQINYPAEPKTEGA